MFDRYTKALEKRLENRGNRNIAIWGTDEFSIYIYKNIIQCFNIKVQYFITDKLSIKCIEGLEVKSINEFEQEVLDHLFILVAVYSGHREAYEYLTSKKLKYNKDFSMMNIGGWTKELNAIDSLLTYTRVEDNAVLQGFKTYGMMNNNTIKIVILGNSTTDSYTGNLKPWVEYFYKSMIREIGSHLIVYNGAIAGYNSTQELLKLIRDVISIDPDLVISFSGFTDISGVGTIDEEQFYLHKYQKRMWNQIMGTEGAIPNSLDMRNINKVYHGLKCVKKDYEYWIENERKMRAICNEFNIKFIGCLQPLIAVKGNIIEKELKELLYDIFRGGGDR